jgi:hypothetical protein
MSHPIAIQLSGSKCARFQGFVVSAAILLICSISYSAPDGNTNMLSLFEMLDNSDKDVRILGAALKLREHVEPAQNRDFVAEFVAVGLLKHKRTDLYLKYTAPLLKRRSLIEQICMRPCTICQGQGEHELDCTRCNGTGKCLQCDGSGLKKIGGKLSGGGVVRCTACRQDGNCLQCKSTGTFRQACKNCDRKRKVWSLEDINVAYDYYLSFVRGALRSPEIMNSIVMITGGKGVGTGFLCEFDGRKFVVSNAHVMIGNQAVTLMLIQGKELGFGNVYMAKDRDVVLFELSDPEDESFLKVIADASALRHGEAVYIYGNSQGAKVATCLIGSIQGVGPTLLETTAEFVSGNSGSPVILDDKVVGIATFATKFSSSWVTDGTRFTKVRRFATRIDNMDMSAFDLLDMDLYGQQNTILDKAKSAVDQILVAVQSGGLRVIIPSDIDGLNEHKSNLKGVERWVSYMMQEEALDYVKIIEAINSAKERGIFANSNNERPQGNVENQGSDVTSIIDALLREQALGRYGFQFWYNSADASMLFAPVTWEVLETIIGDDFSAGITATSTVRIESSMRVGIPIRQLWKFRLRYTNLGWKILSITETN